MMNTNTPPTAGPERGSIALEVAVVAPALLLLIGLVVGAGRIALAEQAVQQAAAQAARDTSLARTPSAGVTAGRATAARVLSGQGLDCTSSSTSVSAAALGYPPGQPGTVTVATTCQVRLGDLVVPGFPGVKTLRAEASMVVDTFSARP
jgi:Flp pilus assembly protein TadG